MQRFEMNLERTIENVCSGFQLDRRNFRRGAVVTTAEENGVNVYVFITTGDETLAGVVDESLTVRQNSESDFVEHDDCKMECQNQKFS